MRRLLLDTCAILRLAAGLASSPTALTALEGNGGFCLAHFPWEIALKARPAIFNCPMNRGCSLTMLSRTMA